jgi:hypothetical protein
MEGSHRSHRDLEIFGAGRAPRTAEAIDKAVLISLLKSERIAISFVEV